jgi:hypothetical protein
MRGSRTEKVGGRMRIKEGGRKAVVLILWAWEKGFPRSSSTRLSDPPGRDEAALQSIAGLTPP